MGNEINRVVDSLPGIVWTAWPDGRIDFLNRSWCEYTGLSTDAAAGRGWWSAVHPDDQSRLLDRWQAILASGERGEIEARLRRCDGEHRRFLFTACPVTDSSGETVKWCGVITDIEERRRSEALLAAERQLLDSVANGRSISELLEALCHIVESTIGGYYCCVVLVDPSGTRLEQAAAPSLPASFITSIVGRAVSAQSGTSAIEDFLNKQVTSAELVSEAPGVADARFVGTFPDKIQSCSCAPILSTAEKIIGAIALYFNKKTVPMAFERDFLTRVAHIAGRAIERIQNEAVLKRSEAFLAEAQQLTKLGSFAWRFAGREITWSDEMYRIYELDPAVPLHNQLIGSRTHPQDREALFEMLARARRDESDIDYEYRLLLPDHSVKHIHMIAHRTRDNKDQMEYIGALHDVTERRLAEEALSKARSELAHLSKVTTLGAMTASIAHEVNQPLSGIITNAGTCLRLLAADPPNVDGARETARRTIRDANRATEVIARLRALFAKTGARTESMDLNEVAREVISFSSSDLQRGDVILRSELAADLPPVTGDRVQLQQVILNIVRNAFESLLDVHDRPRQLAIRTAREEGDCVRLTVQDSGKGFDPQTMNRLFDAFYTTKENGMGIGLSLSRSIIESHCGRLWAVSNDGPGVTFAFSIPSRSKYATGSRSAGEPKTSAIVNAAQVLGRF